MQAIYGIEPDSLSYSSYINKQHVIIGDIDVYLGSPATLYDILYCKESLSARP